MTDCVTIKIYLNERFLNIMVKNNRLRKREFNFNPKNLNLILGLGGISLALILGGITYIGESNYSSSVSDLKTEISKLEGDLSKLETDQSNITPETITQNLYSAKDLGNKVTELQNTWGEALTQSDRDEYAKNGVQSKGVLDTTRIERLNELFVDGDTLGSKQWYPKAEGTKASKGVWKFLTTTSFTTAKQEVIWENVSDDGELFAYVTADFDATQNKFENVKVNITKTGTEAIKTVLGGN